MLRFFFTLILSLLIFTPVSAQFYSTQYRVPDQNWMEVKTERFRLIYPQRYELQAQRSLAILESEYSDIQDLVGGRVRNFPVILNPENDLSNGFVAPLNFRSEIELSPIIGKTMNPQSGNWLELVLPHELVHALHFSKNPSSFTSFLGLFSPDVRRSVHSAAPLGVFEGIAVQHESHGTIPHSGRGNHPYFTNQFSALVDTRHEWSMGQLLQVTDFTPPFDRHYIGGYEFTNWLLSEYGEDTVKQSIDFHYRYPFLGFGTALRAATGNWPRKLYRQFSESVSTLEKTRTSHLGIQTAGILNEVPFNAKCRRLNRPVWLDDESLLFFARTCNRTSGFYRFSAKTGTTDLFYEVSIPSDFQYSLTWDKSELIFSRYYADLRYDRLFRGDLHRLDLTSAKSERITKNRRLFSPEWSGDLIYATQTLADEMRLVSVDPESGEIIKDFSMPELSSVVQVAVNPVDQNKAAVIGRVKSVQGIWFEDLSASDQIFNKNPDIVFGEGSVYDIAWHPDGEKLLFVSDFTGTMNVYEYHSAWRAVTEITNSLHNAFEASYSPDGSKIAFIAQVQLEQKLFVMDRNRAVNRTIHPSLWTHSEKIALKLERPLLNRDPDPDLFEWEPRPYRTGFGWLKPRFWSPTYESEAGLDRIGINLESTDVMSRQAYSVDVNHYADRIWYNFTYRNKHFFPGFVTEFFNEPNFTSLRVPQDEDEETGEEEEEPERVTVLQQSRGGSLKIPIRFRLESNTRFSSLLVEPQYFISQLRFLDAEHTSEQISEFGTRHTIGLRTILNYRVRQFTRDVQPNRGLVLFAEGRYGLNSDEIQIESDRLSVTGNLMQRKGIRTGVITFLSPLSRWNQSLRVSAEIYSQTDVPVFNVLSQFSDHFSEFPLLGVNNVGILNTRYTIPLTYPDDGGLLVPVYLSNIYLVLFSQTVTDLSSRDLMQSSRSVIGAGIRSRFRLSNLAFDFGLSIGWEPTRNDVTYTIGSF